MRKRLISALSYYIKKFCDKNDAECESDDDEILRDLRVWICGISIDLSDLIYDVDSEQPAGKLLEWLDYNELAERPINYQSFCSRKKIVVPTPKVMNFTNIMSADGRFLLIETYNRN